MTPPIRIVLQRAGRDCAVAGLAMFTGRSYEDALDAFRHNVVAKGATVKQVRTAAARLGFETKQADTIDLEDMSGMLVVSSPKWKRYHHIVALMEGWVLDVEDPPTMWSADDYLEAFQAQPLVLIKVIPK